MESSQPRPPSQVTAISWVLFASAALSLLFVALGVGPVRSAQGPLAVRLAFPIMLSVGGVVVRMFPRLVLSCVGISSLVLCTWSALQGSEDLLVMALIAPIIVSMLLPEEQIFGRVMSAASFLCVAAASSYLFAEQRWVWIGQSLTMVILAQVAARRFRQLSRVLSKEADQRIASLTHSLAEASKGFVRVADEAELFRVALAALRELGISAQVLRLEESSFRVVAQSGPLKEPSTDSLKIRASLREAIPMERLAHLTAVVERQETLFHPDLHQVIETFFPPEAWSAAKAMSPRRGVDAPIVVRGVVHGVLTAQSDALSPASTAALELFAGHMGAAVENIHHHQALAQQLNKVTALQKELVSQARLSMLGEAAAVVSHEIRNPLGAIVNAVCLLRRGCEEQTSPEALLAMIESEAMRLDKLVHDLLILARPLEAKLGPVELGAVVKRSVLLLGPDAARVEVRAPDCLWALGDADQLQLALTNLLRNALDASPSGGAVGVQLEVDHGAPVVAVEDSGAGIREEDLGRIFEPFFTTRATGTGLGLAIVKRVVQSHQGEISVTSRSVGGTRFALSLRAQ